MSDQTARIWDAATGQELRQLTGHTAGVLSAAYSPDGKTIVTASADQTARIWDAATGQEAAPAQRPHRLLSSRRPTARTARPIVTASDDQTARIWDAATGQEAAPASAATPARGLVGGLQPGRQDHRHRQ